MRAGRLDQRVTIQEKTVTRDAYGAQVVSWQTIAIVWMEADPLSGREYIAMRQAQSDVTTRFRCRYRPGLTTAHRLVWRDAPYNITEVIDRGGRKTELEILGYAEATPT